MTNKKELQEVIEEIYEIIEKEKNTLVIVEGRKDKKALEELGFNNVVAVNSRPWYEVAESVKEEKVMVLTDLDIKGKQIYSYLSKHLKDRGVYINDELRELIFRTDLRQIEGIVNYLGKFFDKEERRKKQIKHSKK